MFVDQETSLKRFEMIGKRILKAQSSLRVSARENSPALAYRSGEQKKGGGRVSFHSKALLLEFPKI